MKIVIASENAGKIQEISRYLAGMPLSLTSTAAYAIPPVAENGLSFVENALIKARHVAGYSQCAALADDSGLLVAALDGAPGLYSARYAHDKASSEENITALLKVLAEVPETKRQAYFYAAIVFVRHAADPTPLIAWGSWHGRILTARLGEQGFGYDPIFYIDSLGCSAAQLSIEQKNQLSHRGQALAQFRHLLQEHYPIHD